MPIRTTDGTRALAVAVLLVALGVYAQYGLRGKLVRDDALYVYAGQQLAAGVAPYRAVFEHKGPLTPILCGVAVGVGRAFGLDDLVATRLLFGLLSALAVTVLFLLASRLLQARAAGLVAAALFLCFWGFGRHAFSGPRAKTPFVLCELLLFLFAARGRWGRAGAAGSLAALTWQPGAVFAAVAVALAVAAPGAARERRARAARACAGVALPLLLVGAWFALDGSLGAFLDGAVGFNLFFVGRSASGWLERLQRPIAAVFAGYPGMALPIALGLLALPAACLWQGLRSPRGLREPLLEGPAAAVFLSLPAPLAWSLLDFQEYPDFFVFLPYAALGAAGLVGWLAQRAGARLRLRGGPAVLAGAVAALLALGAAVLYRSTAERGLDEQRSAAAALARRVGPTGSVATIGVPQLLVLLHETNPVKHLVLFAGTDDYIEAHEPGGFAGWLAAFERAAPTAVAVDALAISRRGQILSWLRRGYRLERFGPWAVFVRAR